MVQKIYSTLEAQYIHQTTEGFEPLTQAWVEQQHS